MIFTSWSPFSTQKAASVDNGVDFNLPLTHKSVKINDPKAHLVPSPPDHKAHLVPSPPDPKAPGKEVPSPSDLKASGKEDVQPSSDTEKVVVPSPKAGAAVEGKAVGIPTEQRSVRKVSNGKGRGREEEGRGRGECAMKELVAVCINVNEILDFQYWLGCHGDF